MVSDEDNIKSEDLNLLQWSAVRSAKDGEEICGDKYLVRKKKQKVLVAAIDGLGHGIDASVASLRALAFLDSDIHFSYSLTNVVMSCHENLQNTRGVVMSLALINTDHNTFKWIGIGNIDGVLMYKDKGRFKIKNMVLHGGTVGYLLPFVQVSLHRISNGNTLVLTTDGVKRNYTDYIHYSDSTHDIVSKISSNSFKPTDDSLAIAIKYRGS